MREIDIQILDSLVGVQATQWDALVDGNPTLRHAFLQAMIDAGCTNVSTGWLPQFITLWREVEGRSQLTGAVPLYLKTHSYGEYVFDWAWADAYQRAGLDYYPKLLAAVPFTPCTGTRLLAATDADRRLLLDAALQLARDNDVSSLHFLFPLAAEHESMLAAGMLSRSAVQFHWQNAGYESFDAFLATMSHDKRKKIRQERRRVAEAGISFERKLGTDATDADWDFFTRMYEGTYRAHRSTPYLNREFFGQIAQKMGEQILLVVASRAGSPIAASLNLFNRQTLYGRYWGTNEFHSGLHFETCYYQTLEFCIANGIQEFEGGAQGEHKLARGFTPVKCLSAHWLKDARFRSAVADFLVRETDGIDHYVNELEEHVPYKNTSI